MGWGGFLVITVSHPTFCCVGVGLWLRLGLGCDNIYWQCYMCTLSRILTLHYMGSDHPNFIYGEGEDSTPFSSRSVGPEWPRK